MVKNEIALKSHKQAFADPTIFRNWRVRGLVAESVVGKIYCPSREHPLSLLLEGGFVGMREATQRKLICQANCEFWSGKRYIILDYQILSYASNAMKCVVGLSTNIN